MNVRQEGGRWRVSLKRGGRHYGLGTYATREEAVAVAIAGRERLPNVYSGAILLPVAPFAGWLQALPYSTAEIARELGIDQRRVSRVRKARVAQVSERTVERWGIALVGEPRLVERLYATRLSRARKPASAGGPAGSAAT